MRFKRNRAIYIFFVFSFWVLFISVGYSLLSQNLTIIGKGNLVINEPELPDYSTEYTEESWGSGNLYFYNFYITITNNTDKAIYGWNLLIDVPSDTQISSYWDTTSVLEGNKLTLINLNYNGYIDGKKSVTIGITLKTSVANLKLENIEVIIPKEEEEPTPEGPENPDEIAGLIAELIKVNSWQSSGYYITQYDLKIKNNSNKNILSWEVVLLIGNSTVLNYWNVTTRIEDQILYLNNVSYNGKINIGSELVIGFQMQSLISNPTYKIQYITGTY